MSASAIRKTLALHPWAGSQNDFEVLKFSRLTGLASKIICAYSNSNSFSSHSFILLTKQNVEKSFNFSFYLFKKAFANAPFPVAYEEVAAFLRTMGHDNEVIEMLRSFEVSFLFF